MYILMRRGLGEAPAPSTNCSAISVDRFDKQPEDLRRVLGASSNDPAGWFEGLDRERRMALTSIFNRLCSYGLWRHVSRILRVVPGEAPLRAAGHTFIVPGSTPSVYFMTPSWQALHRALMATGKFCMAHGTGASEHKGQTTLREISGSDSLHISLGPGNQFDAHIDRLSPTPGPTGTSFCSNDPTPEALRHIGLEVVSGKIRRISGVPVQAFRDLNPTPTVPRPAPATRQEADLPPTVVSVTAHGPVPRQQPQPRRPSQAGPLLSVGVVERIDRAIKAQVRRDALLPSDVRARIARTRWAAETAGPNEENALRKVRDAAEAETGNYPDAHELALDLAERMEQARRTRAAWVKLDLTGYDGRDFSSRRAIAGEIRRIALIVRDHLPDRAKDVRTIVIFFGSGNSATREEIKLP
jgi:hypothetical protein